jgi:hypothetical protein
MDVIIAAIVLESIIIMSKMGNKGKSRPEDKDT